MTARLPILLLLIATMRVSPVHAEAPLNQAKSPKDAVVEILNECKPASGVYLPLNRASIEKLSPMLSERMVHAMFVCDRMISNTAGPGPYFNQLLWRRWPLDTEHIHSVSVKPERAVIIVEECLKPSKIYAGYKGHTSFLLKLTHGAWIVDDIMIDQRYYYPGKRLPSSDIKGSVIDLIKQLHK